MAVSKSSFPSRGTASRCFAWCARARLQTSFPAHYISVSVCKYRQERHDFDMARTLTNEIIDAAIEGFEAQKQRLDARIVELRSMRDGGSMRDGAGAEQPSAAPRSGRRKRKFSP